MKWERICGVAVLVFAVGASFAPGAMAAQSFAVVTLTYLEGEEPCIAATPDPVMIFWDKKPKKVKWTSDSGDDLYWEIDWKGGEQPDYFGQNFKIKRGEKEKKSDRPKKRGRSAPGASWSYVIRVYETGANVERGRLLCELDPAVDWGD